MEIEIHSFEKCFRYEQLLKAVLKAIFLSQQINPIVSNVLHIYPQYFQGVLKRNKKMC